MIKIDSLNRAYGDFVAVDRVSFSIEKGEIVGLLGHNGAGKTTIMKMLSGYLEPDAGRIEINGMDISTERKAVQQQIGYLPEALPVYPEMSVADYLDYAAELKGLTGDIASSEIRHAVKATDISAKLLAPISTLSRGYKQRVGVAQAILGKPRVLILDEPTNGLDPTQTQQMRELIKEIARDATVILSTHIMQEVDALCDRALIMRGGQLALDASLSELRGSNRLIVRSNISHEDATALLLPLSGVEHLMPVSENRFNVTITTDGNLEETTNLIANALISNKHSVYELKQEQRDLESVFREVNEQGIQEVRHAA
jgi:ABC-2 type transport system ATP-binding protein